MQPGDTERDLALRFAAAAEHMLPIFEPTLLYALRAHMLEQIRRDVIGAADLASGEIGGHHRARGLLRRPGRASPSSARRSTPEELGLVAGRLEEMATAVAEPPVRLVKMIGDAAMLVSAEPEPMLDAALRLVEAAEEEGEEFPYLRAGLARGPGPRPGGRLLRPRGQPRQPHHRRSPGPAASWSTPPTKRGRRRRLRLLLRRRAPPQGHRHPHQALPRPARAENAA